MGGLQIFFESSKIMISTFVSTNISNRVNVCFNRFLNFKAITQAHLDIYNFETKSTEKTGILVKPTLRPFNDRLPVIIIECNRKKEKGLRRRDLGLAWQQKMAGR